MLRTSLVLLFSLVFLASAQEKAGGKLKVTIKPSDAVSAGAKWQVDSDGVWRNSGASVSSLSAGDHSVTFKKVTNWKAPKAQTVADHHRVLDPGVQSLHGHLQHDRVGLAQRLDAGGARSGLDRGCDGGAIRLAASTGKWAEPCGVGLAQEGARG